MAPPSSSFAENGDFDGSERYRSKRKAMIEFMVISAPRSGSAWAANWLTTERSLCLHDPLYRYHYLELDSIQSSRPLGISCTGVANFYEWVNQHPARKVVLHRDPDEVNASLSDIGLPQVPEEFFYKLNKIRGIHVPWRMLFTRPKTIWEHLTDAPFDHERHEYLCRLNVQRDFGGVVVDPVVTRRLVGEIRSAMEN